LPQKKIGEKTEKFETILLIFCWQGSFTLPWREKSLPWDYFVLVRQKGRHKIAFSPDLHL
jgi:hypothetical protein